MTAERRRSSRFLLGLLPWILSALAGAMVAWPFCLFPARMSWDLNTSAHVIVLQHIWRWIEGAEPLGLIPHMNAPTGVEIQVVAWPIMLAATAMYPFVDAFSALNLGQTIMLAAAGPMMLAALRQMGLRGPGALTGAVAWAATPMLLTYTANGQFENCVGFQFSLALWGIARAGWPGALALVLSTFLMGFSSPYQAIPLAFLILTALLLLRPRLWWLMLLLAGMGMIPAVLYYSWPLPFDAPPMGPGPNLSIKPLKVEWLFTPLALAGPDGLPSWGHTLRRTLETFFTPQAVGPRLRDEFRMHIAYLGLILGLLSIGGLLTVRRRPWARAAIVTFILTFVAAKGHTYLVGDIVWPWTWTRFLPGLDKMGMTYRFSTGMSVSLCVLAAIAIDELTIRRPSMGLVGGGLAIMLVLADSFFGGPFKLPHATLQPRLAGGYDALPAQGIVMDLPVVDWEQPELYPFLPPMMGVLHEHPMTYRPVNMMELGIQGTPLVQAVYRGQPLDAEGISTSLQAFRERGITYMVIHTQAMRADTRAFTLFMLESHMGKPSAEGDGVLGWVLPPTP